MIPWEYKVHISLCLLGRKSKHNHTITIVEIKKGLMKVWRKQNKTVRLSHVHPHSLEATRLLIIWFINFTIQFLIPGVLHIKTKQSSVWRRAKRKQEGQVSLWEHVLVLILFLSVERHIQHVALSAAAAAAGRRRPGESFLRDGDDLLPEKHQLRWIFEGTYGFNSNTI